MAAEPKTLQEAIIYFADPELCDKFMIDLRWPDGKVRCPNCGSDNVTHLKKQRRWKCYGNHAKPQFSLKVGTLFEDSPMGLDKWFCAMWLIDSCKNGISSYEIARALGITQKSAWFMLHRIRLAMQTGTFEKKLSGEVEADESYFGGKAEFMHLDKRTRRLAEGTLGRGGHGKAIVLGLLDRNTRKARVKVVGSQKKHELRSEIKERVEPGSAIYTDALKSYRGLPLDGFTHDFIDHAEQYVNGRVHTQGLENFWSLMKRALKGTYVSVEPFHLQAYADEQCFRFNNRELTDLERFKITLSQIVGKRLTYSYLTGKFN